MDERPVHCTMCGAARPRDGRAALEWSSERDGMRVRWMCAPCTRAHTRSIEARLDAEWW